MIEHGDESVWAIEVKRSLSAKVTKGFYIACEDIKPVRAFVVHSGEERYPIAKGVEDIGVCELVRELRKLS